MPDLHVGRADRRYMDAFEAERFYVDPVWEGCAVRLVKVCCALEDAESAKHWAQLAADLSRVYTGSDRGWDAVAAEPERTAWWGARRRAREGRDIGDLV